MTSAVVGVSVAYVLARTVPAADRVSVSLIHFVIGVFVASATTPETSPVQ